jgi:hypothetical protein
VRCRLALCTSTIGLSPVTVIGFFERADAKIRVDRRVEFRGELHAFAFEGAEPGQREGHDVRARPEIHDSIESVAVCDRGANLLDENVARRLDRDAGKHCPRRVPNNTCDG